MILSDPSELREGTRLPKAIVDISISRPGLEKLTGADFLISSLGMPATSEYLLQEHANNGMLVQRKTGTDLSSSITDGRFFTSLEKMKEWTKFPWLVVVGNVERRPDGVSLIAGRPCLTYKAIIGALDKWQLRGGYLTILDDDDALVGWVSSRLDFLRSAEKQEKQIVQNVSLGDSLLNCLCSIPGIGVTRAMSVVKHLEGSEADGMPSRRNLLEALSWLTHPYLELPPGIGEKTRKTVREFLGLGEYDNSYDAVSVTFVPKEKG